MKKILNAPELGILIIRVFAGLAMALAHGYGKLPPSEQLVQGVTAMGFPAPIFFAWAAALAEFFGGLLIAAGLFTRPAAFFLGFTMFVAAFHVHAADPFQQKEMALLYLSISILFLFYGGGRFSLDRILRKV